MDNKADFSRNELTVGDIAHPLKSLSEPEFAALGGDKTVFVRTISAGELARFLPQAQVMPEDARFELIMAADGVPLLVSDDKEAVAAWLAENEVIQVLRH